MSRLVHRDCRAYIGDRPCRPHKETGVICANCKQYDPVKRQILVIKLDALGDVLRTTCILSALHEANPGCTIDWLTRPAATAIFEGNPLVHRVIEYPNQSWLDLQTQRYDLVINLDPSAESGRLASLAQGIEKLGFLCDERGRVQPANPEAQDWFEMGLFDDLKLSNTKTYQDIALAICRLPQHNKDLHLYISDEEQNKAVYLLKSLGVDSTCPIVALNTGASARWPHKKWTLEGYVELIELLGRATEFDSPPVILLLGGQAEAARNQELATASKGRAINVGPDLSLREFFSVLNECDFLVTGDTLAMHAAAALGKRVVALFGPTSVAEIELYGRGRKLSSDAPCVGHYLTTCDVAPTCMERIKATDVFHALLSLADQNIIARTGGTRWKRMGSEQGL